MTPADFARGSGRRNMEDQALLPQNLIFFQGEALEDEMDYWMFSVGHSYLSLS
jgi:hypothetical protein